MSERQARFNDAGVIVDTAAQRIQLCLLCGHLKDPGHDCAQLASVVDGHLPRAPRMDGET